VRRKACQVTDPEEIQRILNSTTFGRLATNGSDGYPYITPVNFVYYEGNIYFHSALRGEKLDNLVRDAKVCFQVDIPLAYLGVGSDPEQRICRLHQLYHCVIIRGQARIVSESALKVAVLNALIAKHECRLDFEPANVDMLGYNACKVVEVKPTFISAKSDLGQNRTYEERLTIAKYLKTQNRPNDLGVVEAMGFDLEDL
jgi:nitroimidazol reductase NimA-like FMN-containing flavoprotein (pyridoxamine 5'-phosphate oxidase superfamily)